MIFSGSPTSAPSPGASAIPPDASRWPRVVIADDQVLFRDMLTTLLKVAGCEVVARVGDADALHSAVAATRPDLAIVDIEMPPTGRHAGLDAALRLRREHPDVGVLLLSNHLATEHLLELVRGGVSGVGYQLKRRVSGDGLLVAIRRVAQGRLSIDEDVSESRYRGGHPKQGVAALSKRQLEVLELTAQSLSNAAIAKRLGVGEKTVEHHLAGIYAKLTIMDEPERNRRVSAVLEYLRFRSDVE